MATRGRPITISEEELLGAAREVFLERGLDATTVEVARRAGISESVIFHRYRTKEALFTAVLERELVMPAEVEDLAPLVGKGEITEHLFRLGSALVEKIQNVFPFFMMAFSSPMKMNELHERICRAHPAMLRMIRLVTGYFEAEVRAGRLRRVDPEILAHAFIGAVRQYVVSEYFERTGEPLPLAPATYLRGMIDILLRGALAEAPASSAGTRRARR